MLAHPDTIRVNAAKRPRFARPNVPRMTPPFWIREATSAIRLPPLHEACWAARRSTEAGLTRRRHSFSGSPTVFRQRASNRTDPHGGMMKLSRLSIIAAFAVAEALLATVSSSQQVASADLRTKTIVASFNKSKHVVREKRGIRKEKYLDVR